MKIRNDSQATSANLTDLKNRVTYFWDIPYGIGLQYLQLELLFHWLKVKKKVKINKRLPNKLDITNI